MSTRSIALGVAAVMAAMSLSGCSFTGLNSFTLPFSKGGGGDAISATVVLKNATNLVPNSEVKYGEITIGSVRKIELDGWNAQLTIGLDRSARVPADVTAKVAQKSLLGAEYLELKDPAHHEGVAATAVSSTVTEGDAVPLKNGAVIGLNRTGRYPETEELLSAASLLLNGGGMPQIKTISHEVNTALTGRNGDTKSLVKQVDLTSRELDSQRDSITGAMEQLDALSSTVNKQRDVVDDALVTLPEGVDVLRSEEPQLVKSFQSFARIEDVARTGLGGNGAQLGRILDNLRPVTKALADVGGRTASLLENLTYPFPLRSVKKIGSSGYANITTDIKISAPQVAKNFLGVTSLDKLFTGFIGNAPSGTAAESTDPLTGPVDNLPGGKKDSPQTSDPATPPPNAHAPAESHPPGRLENLIGGN